MVFDLQFILLNVKQTLILIHTVCCLHTKKNNLDIVKKFTQPLSLQIKIIAKQAECKFEFS